MARVAGFLACIMLYVAGIATAVMMQANCWALDIEGPSGELEPTYGFEPWVYITAVAVMLSMSGFLALVAKATSSKK